MLNHLSDGDSEFCVTNHVEAIYSLPPPTLDYTEERKIGEVQIQRDDRDC